MSDFSHLAEPLEGSRLQLKNRVVHPAILTLLVKEQAVDAGQTLSIGSEGIHGVRTADPTEDSFALHVYLGRLATQARYLYPKDGSTPRPFTPEAFSEMLQKR